MKNELAAAKAAEPKPRSLWWLSAFQAISAGSAVFLFLLLVIAGRLLGPEDFGRFSFALAFVFLFDVVLDPGLYHYLIRETARSREQTPRFLAGALTWKLIAAPVVLLLVVVTANLMHDSEETLLAVYLIAVAHVLRSVKEVLRAFLLGRELFAWDALSVCTERILLLVAGSAVLWLGGGLIGLCLTFIVVRVIDVGIIVTIVAKLVSRVKLAFDFGFLRKMVFAAAPIGAFYVTIVVYNYVDTVMLSAIRSEEEVGWYGAAYRIYEGLFIAPLIISNVFMPRLSRYFQQDTGMFEALLSRGMKYAFVLGLVVATNVFILSELVIGLSFGERYDSAVLALNILALGIPVVYAVHFSQTSAITMDRQHMIFVLSAIGLAANVLLNAMFIPAFGLYGAAAVTVVVESLVFLGLLSRFRRLVSNLRLWDIFLKPAVAVGLPVLVVQWSLVDTPLFWRFLAANLGILVCALAFRVLDAEERVEIRRILQRIAR